MYFYQIKKTLVGKGHATKGQVSYMVCESLKLNTAPNTFKNNSDTLG
jgi:Holliday junction resolvasome RuvABC endonuclease subunit